MRSRRSLFENCFALAHSFIFDKDDRDPNQDVDLPPEHSFQTLAPVMSFYAAQKDRFSDIPWPSSEDWEGACGEVFCNTFIHKRDEMGAPDFGKGPRDLFTEANFQKFKRSWEDKVGLSGTNSQTSA